MLKFYTFEGTHIYDQGFLITAPNVSVFNLYGYIVNIFTHCQITKADLTRVNINILKYSV